jgi:hypothetical protein
MSDFYYTEDKQSLHLLTELLNDFEKGDYNG